MSCRNCRYFEPYVNPLTGRRKKTEPGNCVYPLPEKLPFWTCLKVRRAQVFEYEGNSCQTFEAKETTLEPQE